MQFNHIDNPKLRSLHAFRIFNRMDEENLLWCKDKPVKEVSELSRYSNNTLPLASLNLLYGSRKVHTLVFTNKLSKIAFRPISPISFRSKKMLSKLLFLFISSAISLASQSDKLLSSKSSAVTWLPGIFTYELILYLLLFSF